MLASDLITLGAAIFALLTAVAGSSACAYNSSRNGRINIAVLKAKIFALDNLIGSFQRQLAGITIIKPDPKQWVSKARGFLATINVSVLEESVEDKCLCGWIPKYCTQIGAGRLIESMIAQLDVLLEEGHRISRDSTVKGHKQHEVTIVGATRIQIIGEIWKSVADPDGAGCVHIHGVVGVGKTVIAAVIHNQALAEVEIFEHVIWVSVKYGVGLWQVQEDIASSLDIDISSISDTSERARRISSALIQKTKFLLVLDSMWQAFSLKDIGIPGPTGGSKLIITGRTRSVCKRVVRKESFEVKPLPEEEAWELFENEVGPKLSLLSNDTAVDTEALLRDLDGLPLAIKMLAQILSEINDDYYSNRLEPAWKEELGALRQGGAALLGYRDQELFDFFQHSYDYLRFETRPCFLFCALYPRDHSIDTRELIEYWVWEGFLGKIDSLEEIMRHGKETLKELKDAHLLETVIHEGREESVKMLNLTRLMAINIIHSLGHKVLIRSGVSLTDFPPLQDWPPDVERVSFMKNQLRSLNPKSKPTNCKKLSTLLLQDNPLDFIPTTNLRPLDLITSTTSDNFFYGMRDLKLLDLSRTMISTLPNSLCYSVNLRALLLRNCSKLKTLPSLSHLQNLIVLDLQGTPLEHCPDGIQYLSKLMRLDMSKTRLDTFPSNVIAKLKQLEELYLITDDRGGYLWGSTHVDSSWRGACVEELAILLQIPVVVLQLTFLNARVFNRYIEACNKLKEQNSTVISTSPTRFKFIVGGFHTDGYGGFGENNVTVIGDYRVMLPKGTSELFLMISNEKITTLKLDGCFRDLSLLDVSNFLGLNSLLSVNILGSLRNLRRISVRQCEEMVEVVHPEAEGNPSTISLPELTVIIFYGLTKLKSVCQGQVLNCPRLCSFEVWGCNQLKLPMMLGRKRGRIEIKGEKRWLDALEWDNPNNVNALFQDKPHSNSKFRLVDADVPEKLVSTSRVMKMKRTASTTSAPDVLQTSDAMTTFSSTSSFLRRTLRIPGIAMPRATSSNGGNNRKVSAEGGGSSGTLRQVLNMVNVVSSLGGSGSGSSKGNSTRLT